MEKLMVKELGETNGGMIVNSAVVEFIQLRPERCNVAYHLQKTLKSDNSEFQPTSAPTINIDIEEMKKEKWLAGFEKYILSKIPD